MGLRPGTTANSLNKILHSVAPRGRRWPIGRMRGPTSAACPGKKIAAYSNSIPVPKSVEKQQTFPSVIRGDVVMHGIEIEK